MKLHWRSDAETDIEFWTHEWTKHGTCFSDNATPATFFKQVLDLYAANDPYNTMESAGMAPDSDTKITLSDFEAAFSHKIAYTCETVNGKDYLSTIEQCFTPSIEAMDCPSSRTYCGSYFYWPTMSQNQTN
jgi:ribonuclease T2